jgi:hypothetical protein
MPLKALFCAVSSVTETVLREIMFYFVFAIFSLGTALLQSAYLRAPKGIVPTRRRYTYTGIALVCTLLEILIGGLRIDPAFVGFTLWIPLFYGVNRGVNATGLRLRYTFRIGFVLALCTLYPLVHDSWNALGL